MTLDADLAVERRRLKRRLTFWRIAAVVAVVVAVIAAAGRFDVIGSRDHVARITIEGLILDDQAVHEAFAKVAGNGRSKALLVKINSPGGTYVGGESLYRSIRRVADRKPVVALMGTTATSAGYMVALGADRVLARASSLTGSIGVIMQTADVTGLLDKIGIKPETVKSAPLKAQPNPMEPFSPTARKATEAIIKDFYDQFVDLVAERRSLDRARVVVLADGRVYSGRQAAENGLVDAIGAEPEARKWLAEVHAVAETLPVQDVEIENTAKAWLRMFDSMIGKVLFSERLRLDGVISLWHPGGW